MTFPDLKILGKAPLPQGFKKNLLEKRVLYRTNLEFYFRHYEFRKKPPQTCFDCITTINSCLLSVGIDMKVDTWYDCRYLLFP